MLRTICVACRHDSHEKCQGGVKPPEGVLGGWECVCDHAERRSDYRREILDQLGLKRVSDQLGNHPDTRIV